MKKNNRVVKGSPLNKKGNFMLGLGIAFGVLIFIVLLIGMMIAGTYNGLVQKDVGVSKQWANVQTAYERRLDLIPNLVETVKGVSKFEQDTQTQIAALRSGVEKAKTTDDLNAVDTKMNSLISGITVNVEAYPTLKASDAYRSLMDSLEGTENRIKWERDNYNTAVQDYQTSVRSFPTNIIAGMFGFNVDKWQMFEAKSGAENAVNVSFS